MYHTFNEGKTVVIERFNRTSKNIMWMHFTANNTNTNLDVLPSIVDKNNNAFHRTINMTPTEASQETKTGQVYFNLLKDKRIQVTPQNLNQMIRFVLVNIRKKGIYTNWTEKIFVVDKVNMTNPVTYNLIDLKNEKVLGSFYQPE